MGNTPITIKISIDGAITQVVTPSLTESGTYYNDTQIIMSCDTPEAIIRYTTDGVTIPTLTTGEMYSSIITITTPQTIIAKAFKTDCRDSSNNTKSYLLKVSTPLIDVESGTYNIDKACMVYCGTSGSTIRYRTDKVTPTSIDDGIQINSEDYIHVTSTTTFIFKAFRQGYADSEPVIRSYIIDYPNCASPVYNIISGTYKVNQTVTISSNTSGSSINYTIDGSNPTKDITSNCFQYVEGTHIDIDTTTTIKSIAFKDKMDDSNISTLECIINVSTNPATPVGSGQLNDPYLVSTLGNLIWISSPDSITSTPTFNQRMSSYYKQTTNIDATETIDLNSGNGFTPIGNSETSFSGVYDGDYFMIENLNINTVINDGVLNYETGTGMFGNVSGQVKNIVLDSCNIIGKNNTGSLIGKAVGNSCNISCTGSNNCIINGTESVGGLIGLQSSYVVINYSYSTNNNIYGVSEVGGFVGTKDVDSSWISNCYSSSRIERLSPYTSNYFGGFIGRIYSGVTQGVQTSYAKTLIYENSTTVWSSNTNGFSGSSGTTSNCFFDKEYSNQASDNASATPLSSEKMTHLEEYNNWSFKPVSSIGYWNIWNNRNSDYPYLDWQYPLDQGYSNSATPTFSPDGGGQPYAFEDVTISCTTSGANVYYTLDGSEPNQSSTIYSVPLTIESDTTVKARSYKNGTVRSLIASAFFDITGTLSTPIISPVANTYQTAQLITITSNNDDDDIYYTIDGTEPTKSSYLYTTPLTVSYSQTIRAISCKTDWNNSSSSTNIYNIFGTLSVPTFSPNGGSVGDIVEISFDPNSGVNGSDTQYSIDNDTTWNNYIEPFTVLSEGNIQARSFNTGWTPSIESESNCFYIENKQSTPSINPPPQILSNESLVVLSSPGANFIYYTIDSSTPTEESEIYSQPIQITPGMVISAIATSSLQGWSNSDIANSIKEPYSFKVATPYVSLLSNTYTTDQTATIYCSTYGAVTRYNTNGVTPTSTTGTIINPGENINITSSMTLVVKSFKTGYTDSDSVTRNYVIDYPNCELPVFNPAGNIYTSDQVVNISCATPGSSINYTIDGSNPTSTISGTCFKYVSSIPIEMTQVIKAIAYKTGYDPSTELSNVYTLTCANAVLSPSTNSYTTIQTVSITTATTGATIYYTLDGSTPTISSSVYATSLSVDVTKTIKALVVKSGYTNSSISSATYTINLVDCATPTFSPVAGTYSATQTVTISSTTSGATIRYTTDGSTPTASVGTVYTGAVTVEASKTLNAIAYKTGYDNSTVGSAAYVLNLLYMPPSLGTGTVGDPYQISQAKNLMWLSATDAQVASPSYATRMAANYIQTANIDMNVAPINTGVGFAPIGNNTIPFSGTYNGNNYSIVNLFINSSSVVYTGLFGQISGSLFNILIADCSVTGVGSSVASLAGYSFGAVISNCSSSGSLSNAGIVGGMIGNGSVTATNCHCSCSIVCSSQHAGGFIAYMLGGSLTNCSSSGAINITGYTGNTGGLVGCLSNSILTKCYSTTTITTNQVTGPYGGFVGTTSGTSVITFCYCGGELSAPNAFNIGGFIGGNSAESSQEQCYSYSVVKLNGSIQTNKGFSAYATGTFTNCYFNSTVSGATTTLGTATALTSEEALVITNYTNWVFYPSADYTWIAPVAGTNQGMPTFEYIPFITEWTVSGTGTGLRITLPLYPGTFNCTVDWGDGTAIQTITSYDSANRIHTYAAGGTYQVKIKGLCPGWSFTTTSTGAGIDKLKITKVVQWGNVAFSYMANGFTSCQNLTSLGADGIKGSVTSFSNLFYNCPSLASLPSDLFRYSVNVTSFSNLFYNCPSLASLPSDLFRYSVNVTSFSSVFDYCSGLTSLPSDLFRYNVNVTSFSSVFSNCSGLTSLPSDLFRYNVNVTSFGSAFGRCSSLALLPSDLFRYSVNVTSFSSVFDDCSGLTSLPSDLFRYNVNVTSFSSAFDGCLSLASLPSDLFRYNVNVTSFGYTFVFCSKLQLHSTIFSEVNDYTRFNGKTVNFTGCFSRTSFTGTQGTAPAMWSYTGLTSTKTGCFGGAGNSTTSLSNYDATTAWR